MRNHICHADGCAIAVQPKILMCRRHWFMVPKAIQVEIYKHYRKGQEIDKKPSEDYMMAYGKAVNAVAAREKRPLPFPMIK